MKHRILLLFVLPLFSMAALAQNNRATVHQDGEENDWSVSQTGSENAFNQEPANQYFVPKVEGDFNTLVASQSGSKNTLNVMQYGVSNEAYVTQVGTGHLGWIEHGSRYHASGGDNNVVRLDQSGTRHTAIVRQSGDLNDFDMDQVGGDRATMRLYEIRGSNNIGTFLQDGSGASQQLYQENSIRYEVSGSSNETYIAQYGAMQSFGLVIDGDANQVTSTQNADQISGEKNYLWTSIIGDGNTLTLSQTGKSNSVGSSFADPGIDIVGSANTVWLQQGSDGNSASVIINGTNNIATITQN